VKVGDMTIPTSHSNDVTRLLGTKCWSSSFFRIRIQHFLRLLAYSHHEIIMSEIFQESKHGLAVLSSLEHLGSLVDGLFADADELMSGFFGKDDQWICISWWRKLRQ